MGLTQPWRAPLEALIARIGDPARGPLSFAALNAEATRIDLRTLDGRPLRFVESTDAFDASASAYEQRIWAHGQILTRSTGRGACHDGFNALCWLAFPALRARLNAVQAAALVQASTSVPSTTGPAGRGWVRDQVTLFDESGVVLVTRERGLADALRRADWLDLFGTRRASWSGSARVWVVGHALHEKLIQPYKALCGRVLVLDGDPDASRETVDQAASEALSRALSGDLEPDAKAEGPRRAALPVMPLMGLPGWCDDNEDPAFYQDPLVFRPRRP
ncbi:MAG: hypothetical protein RL322_3302 [Pseudomonadota bacterium]|jgi:hypothetical protein